MKEHVIFPSSVVVPHTFVCKYTRQSKGYFTYLLTA